MIGPLRTSLFRELQFQKFIHAIGLTRLVKVQGPSRFLIFLLETERRLVIITHRPSHRTFTITLVVMIVKNLLKPLKEL